MLPVISGLIACTCYLVATLLQARAMLAGAGPGHLVRLLGGAAMLFHGLLIYQDVYGASGFDLGVYPMLSMTSLSIVAIVMLSSLRRPVDNLFIIIFPLAAAAILLAMALPGGYSAHDGVSSGILSHIILSVIAYSLLTIAAVQALLLSFGDSLMRHRRLAILRNMPSLEAMEQLMFEMLWFGLMFLTLSIVSGFIFLEDMSGPGLIHHTAITFAAWVVFIILTWGRRQLGWRGAVASRWVLSGFLLLALGYFGSKIVLEIILGHG